MPVSLRPTPVLKGESARRFLAHTTWVDERIKRKIANIQGEAYEDVLHTLDYDDWETWYLEYYRKTLNIKPDDYTFDEGYW